MNSAPHILLQPLGTSSARFTVLGVLLLLAASATCVLAAPLAMPDGYSWLTNAISESAAQGLQSAWIARLGFLLFGCAVLWLAAYLRSIWARGAYWMQVAFAICMIGTAAFSHKPWLANVPLDLFEDLLHSVTATGMGFAFSFGVVARLFQRGNGEHLKKALDVIALVAATSLSPLGELWPSIAGLLQRTLFGVAYLWFAYEALAASTPISRQSSAPIQRAPHGGA
ncbi:MAG: DUF998 domain-containing protein [Burkholderiales bacterium]